MRPHGEERLALREAAEQLQAELEGTRKGPTARDMAMRAQVGLRKARQVIDAMVRSGELSIVDTLNVGRGRPASMFAVTPALGPGALPTPLDEVRALESAG